MSGFRSLIGGGFLPHVLDDWRKFSATCSLKKHSEDGQ